MSKSSDEALACAKRLKEQTFSCDGDTTNQMAAIIDIYMLPLRDAARSADNKGFLVEGELRTENERLCDELISKIEILELENKRLLEDWKKQNDAADRAAHLIVETGVVPGIDSTCRCDGCKKTAIAMDDAGYLEDVKDRWWSDVDGAAKGVGDV